MTKFKQQGDGEGGVGPLENLLTLHSAHPDPPPCAPSYNTRVYLIAVSLPKHGKGVSGKRQQLPRKHWTQWALNMYLK